jgi:hypothetical protein
MKRFLLFFLSAMLFFKCASDATNQEKSIEKSTVAVKLICEPVAGAYQDVNPQNDVYFLHGENKVKVGTISTCQNLDASEWSQAGIPDSAFVACGGWWAGGGDYFFVIQDAGELRVMQISVDEMQEGTPQPKVVYAEEK